MKANVGKTCDSESKLRLKTSSYVSSGSVVAVVKVKRSKSQTIGSNRSFGHCRIVSEVTSPFRDASIFEHL
jgi:hypothetical protein